MFKKKPKWVESFTLIFLEKTLKKEKKLMAQKDQISRGMVRRVMGYGAIVQLDDGTSGLIHISEMANRYVKDVREFCIEGAPIVVQVLRQKEDGRWEFSIKAARNNPDAAQLFEEVAAEIAANPPLPMDDQSYGENFGGDSPMYDDAAARADFVRTSVSPKNRAAFDEKLRDFLTDSSDRIEDVKRHHENRLGGKRR